MPPAPQSEPANADPQHAAVEPPFNSRPGWWLQVLRVRLRFVLIVIVIGVLVSQWPLVRAVWDRWVWSVGSPHQLGAISGSHEYFCPMDPGVVSEWPAICPICNMDLVTRKKTDAVILPEGVLARMQLSPYRMQLAGIRTSPVQYRPLTYEQTCSGVLQRKDDGSVAFESSISAIGGSAVPTGTATVQSLASSEQAKASVSIVNGSVPPRLSVVLDDPVAIAAGTAVMANLLLKFDSDQETLSVPESAVIDRGPQRLVYVESMAGMFDGVEVELGRRCSGFYPVVKGLKPGQRVATAGAFLIDAETRLNPSLAAGYFGANQGDSNRTSSPAPTVVSPLASTPLTSAAKPAAAKSKLSREDQALADKQKICPVTELPLSSMGGPIPIIVSGRKVFICCGGCEKRLKDDPVKYLARISAN